MQSESVHCCVTSPPYWGLRDYGVPGQLGLERTPEEYVQKIVAIFAEVRRVLRSDGTLWLNLGDSYASGKSRYSTKEQSILGGGERSAKYGQLHHGGKPDLYFHPTLKDKDLVGIPWRVAFALQADGWYLRQDIIWQKPNPMPESVRDRCTKAHEYIFLLAKSTKYYYDAEAVKEDLSDKSRERRKYHAKNVCSSKYHQCADDLVKPDFLSGTDGDARWPSKRNRRSVWTITTKPYKEAHFATFPPELPTTCIKAGTSEKGCCHVCGSPYERQIAKQTGSTIESVNGANTGVNNKLPYHANNPHRMRLTKHEIATNRTGNVSYHDPLHTKAYSAVTTLGWQPSCSCENSEPSPCIVLDPFSGAGTTGLVALQLGRGYVGIELNAEYIEISKRRLSVERLNADTPQLRLPESSETPGV